MIFKVKNIIKVLITTIIISVSMFYSMVFANNAPIYYPSNNGIISEGYYATPLDVPPYIGYTEPLQIYYNNALNTYGYLNNYREDNYVYSDGRKDESNYNGILSHIIGDFDNDTEPELAILRITTNGFGEPTEKNIILEIIKMVEGMAVLTDTMTIDTIFFDGESIDAYFGYKKIDDDNIRFYYNYFEKKVIDNEINNRFKAIDYRDSLNVVTEAYYNAIVDDREYYSDEYEFLNQVLDSGIVLQDDIEICKRPFIYEDVSIRPMLTIKRINESMRSGFLEDYMDSHGEEMNIQGFVRARYGYTTFMDRENE